jgi:hypothetical protein
MNIKGFIGRNVDIERNRNVQSKSTKEKVKKITLCELGDFLSVLCGKLTTEGMESLHRELIAI